MSRQITPLRTMGAQELAVALREIRSQAPQLLDRVRKINSYAVADVGAYRRVLAIFSGFATDVPTFIAACQTRAQALTIVELLAPDALELKAYYALAAYSRATTWFEVKRATSSVGEEVAA